MPTFSKITNEVARVAAQNKYRRIVSDIAECEELMHQIQLDMTMSDEAVIESNGYYAGVIEGYRTELAGLLEWV